ncbi:MAG: MBL fold metallo-hydrolase [Treponema sp.]|jgi:glyoxylase-like metal-dependent hydrolase (beta-lactamase superfamily II)|nr:MBL fold metallo-hydrolase [Treponema sp.]
MKLFFHYCSYGFSNCYIIGEENSGTQNAAVIVDPGSMENTILEIIENNNFDLKAVLITHNHLHHVHGLRTIKRIYDPEVFAVNQIVMEHKPAIVKDGDTINIAGFTVEVISVPGHSSDSVVYRLGGLLFTGDALTAGLVGSTASAYGAATQMNKLRTRLLSLPGDYIVLPGHGPPSTLEAERRFNTDISHYDQFRNRKPSFISRVDV